MMMPIESRTQKKEGERMLISGTARNLGSSSKGVEVSGYLNNLLIYHECGHYLRTDHESRSQKLDWMHCDLLYT
jgi:hypothetical protein